MRFLSLLLFIQLLGVSPAGAQSTLNGLVVDPTGLPIAGAGVFLHSQDRDSEFVETDSKGRFSFAAAAGEYRLEALAPGFAVMERSVRAPSDEPIRLELRLEAGREEVTVSADRPGALAVDPAENRSAIALEKTFLKTLPVLDQDIVGLAGSLLDDAMIGGGGPTLVVDGLETDALGVTASAIAEVRINKNPYSAEYSRPGSGRIEVITRQGSQELHGDLNALLRDSRLDARNAFAAERPPQRRRRFEGDLTGPVEGGGRSTFLISAERDDDERQSFVFAQTPDGVLRENVAQPERETEFSGRFRRYPNDKTTWAIRYDYEQESERDGAGGFVLPEAGDLENSREQSVRFDQTWFPAPDWLVELTVQGERESSRTESVTPGTPTIVVQDAFTAGGAQRDSLWRETEVETALSLSWYGNRHQFRGGLRIPDFSYHQIEDRNNFDGVWTFASLQDYRDGAPLRFTQRTGDPELSFWTARAALFAQDDIKLRDNLTLGLGLRYERERRMPDGDNFAPRASLSWGLGDDRRTVIRTGGGYFYDDLGGSTVRDLLRFDGVRLRETLTLNPSYPQPPTAGGALPAEIVRLQDSLNAPRLLQWSFGIERRIREGLTLAATWSETRGENLLRSVDRNAPIGPDFERPDPTVSILREVRSGGEMLSRRLNVNLRGSIGNRFRGVLRYTWGRAYDNADDWDDLPPDSRDWSTEWGRSDYDRRHSFRAMGSVAMPLSLGLGAVLEADSGRPFDWTTGVDRNRDGRAAERPEGVPRNALQRPGELELDVRLSREFQLGEDGPELTVSADAFNALNRVNFSRVIGNQRSSLFLQPVAADSARRLQLSLSLEF